MATLTRCCCWFKRQQSAVLSDESKPERRPKSVNILLGCFFLINYNLGNGFLTYPYSFYYAGYLAAIPTLLLITFMCTIAAIWEVEVMARAQVGSTEVGLCMWPGNPLLSYYKDHSEGMHLCFCFCFCFCHPTRPWFEIL